MPSKNLFSIIILALIGAIGWLLWSRQSTTPNDTNTGKQVCPEAWYEDRMPSIDGATGQRSTSSDQYFVVDGQRVGLSELDVEWIKGNCTVNKPEVVQ